MLRRVVTASKLWCWFQQGRYDFMTLMKCVGKVLIYFPPKCKPSTLIWHCCSLSWMLWGAFIHFVENLRWSCLLNSVEAFITSVQWVLMQQLCETRSWVTLIHIQISCLEKTISSSGMKSVCWLKKHWSSKLQGLGQDMATKICKSLQGTKLLVETNIWATKARIDKGCWCMLASS